MNRLSEATVGNLVDNVLISCDIHVFSRYLELVLVDKCSSSSEEELDEVSEL
jgi:hypothetical protein